MYGGLLTTTSTVAARSSKASARSPCRSSTPVPARLRVAQPWADSSSSTACTRAAGTSSATALAIAPEPVPRSTTTGSADPAACSTAQPARSSVSGRGTNTPGPTSRSTWRKCATPVRCCSGSRPTRRATSTSYCSARGAGTSSTSGSRERSTPSTCASSACASYAGESTPAAVRRAVAAARRSRRVGTSGLDRGEPGLEVGLDAGVHHRLEVAVEDLVEVVGLVAGAVVGDPVLRVVVGADPLGAVDGAHLAAPRLAGGRLGLLLGGREQ